jgi:hypothetical protein
MTDAVLFIGVTEGLTTFCVIEDELFVDLNGSGFNAYYGYYGSSIFFVDPGIGFILA